MKRLSLVAWTLALALSTTAALAQTRFSRRKMGVVFRDGVPHLYFSARDLLHGARRHKLEGGLPQRLVIAHTAVRLRTGRPITAGGQSCRVVYDLWQTTYRVQRQRDRGREERFVLATLQEVLDRCLVLRNVPLGRARDFRSGEVVQIRSVFELNPLSDRTLARIRRWLARPGGGATLEDSAFFGSFVSLFVNQRIGSAERTLRLRSQNVRVP